MKFLIGIAFLAVTQVGCNPYGIIDGPAGDAQLLSKARACFDDGDYACAAKYYGQLSSASSDQSNSEQAFLLLAQSGAGASAFVNAAITGASSGGKLITKLAGYMTATAGQSNRLNIFHAYQKYAAMNDVKSQGLVRFVTSLALIAEVLAEDAGVAGQIRREDYVAIPISCLASGPLYLNSSCYKPVGKKIVTGTAITLKTATDTQMSGDPTLNMINAAISELSAGINQMESIGGASASSLAFASSVGGVELVGGTGDSPAYRGTLIQFDIGSN